MINMVAPYLEQSTYTEKVDLAGLVKQRDRSATQRLFKGKRHNAKLLLHSRRYESTFLLNSFFSSLNIKEETGGNY